MKPLILVSNDDGVNAKGLVTLARKLKTLGHVIVVAPDSQRSAASHSITLHRPLRIERVRKDAYAVDGTPTDCIMIAMNEILKDERPDIIVSGINHGANIGDDVHYSGTVSAAIEGGILGIPSIAISLVVDTRCDYQPAADFAANIARRIVKEKLPKGVILNINVPDVTSDNIKGIMPTKLGKRNYGNVIVEKLDPRGKKYYWIGGDKADFEDIPGSDCNAVLDGFISVTPLKVDITDRPALNNLTKWKW